ncbi:MAG TPA: cysteine hydrolase family protein [Anaerolineales bacterium]|nr:cysteine hydrolase family protein [Anaerolineales bacterium]
MSPQNTALLVIDVQQELFQKSTKIYQAEALLANINTLVERAHRGGAPVVYIQHSSDRILLKGSPGWELHEQLRPLPEDPIVYKEHGNAFEDTNLAEILQGKHITRLVITGLVTHGCVNATVMGALELGYQVTLVKDAHSSYSKDAAKRIEELHQKLSATKAEVKPTQEITFG